MFFSPRITKNPLRSLGAALLLSCRLAACSPGPHPPGQGEGPMTVQFVGAGGPIALGQSMSSGTQFDMVITVDKPSYIYVVQFFPDHTVQQIYPTKAPILIPARTPTTIPGGGQTFELDQTPGTEVVYFISSPQPIEATDQQLTGLLTEVAAFRSTAPPPASSTPLPASVPPSAPSPLPASAPSSPPPTAPSPSVTPNALREPTKGATMDSPKKPSPPPHRDRASEPELAPPSTRRRDIGEVEKDFQTRAVVIGQKGPEWSKGLQSVQTNGVGVFRLSFAHTLR